jgi:hypothetical protein
MRRGRRRKKRKERIASSEGFMMNGETWKRMKPGRRGLLQKPTKDKRVLPSRD